VTGSTVESVIEVLEDGGFERLPRPLVVAGSAFEFDAAARGTGVSHDLVVVATSAEAPRRLVRLLSGLSRVLDQVASKRPVTLVLVGDTPDQSTIADLERHARVLSVDHHPASAEQVREAVAVLLPLELPLSSAPAADPLAAVADILGPRMSSDHQALLQAAKLGPGAVREALRRYIDAAVSGGETEGAGQ
jgi:hypothetical protein